MTHATDPTLIERASAERDAIGRARLDEWKARVAALRARTAEQKGDRHD